MPIKELCHPRISAACQVKNTLRGIAYLLALTVRNQGRFDAFDRCISPAAVIGAPEDHLVTLAAG